MKSNDYVQGKNSRWKTRKLSAIAFRALGAFGADFHYLFLFRFFAFSTFSLVYILTSFVCFWFLAPRHQRCQVSATVDRQRTHRQKTEDACKTMNMSFASVISKQHYTRAWTYFHCDAERSGTLRFFSSHSDKDFSIWVMLSGSIFCFYDVPFILRPVQLGLKVVTMTKIKIH